MKKTPLYEKHRASGGRMIDFGGWLLPVQYGGILEEHAAVRERAGLFDVSHMGEILVRGKNAAAFLQRLVTNDLSAAQAGRAVYSPMCAPDGGTVDDLLIYKRAEDSFLVVVNAANADKDYEWITAHRAEGVELENASEDYAQLALQGPRAQAILSLLTGCPLDEIRFYRFREEVPVAGIPCLVSRTGYTGEDGFELYLPAGKAPALWDALLEAGRPLGLVPAGLGARDTLRFEAALPLYGHELSPTISPLEAGLGHFVKLGKSDFIGRQALLAVSEAGVKRRLIGFGMTGRGVARENYPVRSEGREIGFVTSGSYAPTLQKNLGLALVDAAFAGDTLEILIRGKAVEARVLPLPFYTKKYKK